MENKGVLVYKLVWSRSMFSEIDSLVFAFVQAREFAISLICILTDRVLLELDWWLHREVFC